MLQALIHGKHHHLNREDTPISFKEDTLTACVFGRLQYLPEEILKNVIATAVNSNNSAQCDANSLGALQEVFFWPSYTHPSQIRVEPDVVFEFEHLILIVEAKRWDNIQQQYVEQWDREIEAIKFTYPNPASKELRLLAVGGSKGNVTKEGIWQISWATLVKTLDACCKDAAQHIRTLVEDIKCSMAYHDMPMRDPVYLDTFAAKVLALPLCVAKADFFLARVASSLTKNLTTFTKALNSTFSVDVQKTFGGVHHG